LFFLFFFFLLLLLVAATNSMASTRWNHRLSLSYNNASFLASCYGYFDSLRDGTIFWTCKIHIILLYILCKSQNECHVPQTAQMRWSTADWAIKNSQSSSNSLNNNPRRRMINAISTSSACAWLSLPCQRCTHRLQAQWQVDVSSELALVSSHLLPRSLWSSCLLPYKSDQYYKSTRSHNCNEELHTAD